MQVLVLDRGSMLTAIYLVMVEALQRLQSPEILQDYSANAEAVPYTYHAVLDAVH